MNDLLNVIKNRLDYAKNEDKFYEPDNYIWVTNPEGVNLLVQCYDGKAINFDTSTLFGIDVQVKVRVDNKGNPITDDPVRLDLYKKVDC